MSFKGENTIEINYDEYCKIFNSYTKTGGPKICPSKKELIEKLKNGFLEHQNNISGNNLYDITKKYFAYLENKISGIDFYFSNGNFSLCDFSVEKMKKKWSTGEIILYFSRAWYFNVIDMENFVIIQMMNNIFEKFGGKMISYIIDEVDDSAYFEISFVKI